jgi:hypothetical protein
LRDMLDPEAVLEKHPHIVMRGVLDAPIGVMDDPLGGMAIDNGHLKSLQAQGGIDMAGNGIAHGSASEDVQDDRQIDEGTADADIGNIRHPCLVGTGHREVLQEIGIDPVAVVAVGGPDPAAFWFLEQTAFAHDTVYFLVVDRSTPAV